jgi:diguanylate cyclase (GGDEF)-like protein
MRAPADTRQGRIHVLLVEDNPGDARLVQEELLDGAERGLAVRCVPTLREALGVVAEDPVDVVLLDLGLPDSKGLATLTRLAAAAPAIPIVVLTGLDDSDLAVRSLTAKAQEFMPKAEIFGPRLLRAISQAIERQRLQSERTHLVERLQESSLRSRELVSACADGILVLDAEGHILFANPAATRLMGVRAEELLNRVVPGALADGETIEVEFRPDQVVELRAVGIEWENAPALLATLRDITGHRTAEQALKKLNTRLQASNSKLERLALADPLTELLNRRGIEHMLESEISRARRKGAPLTACLIDCDGFKQINDVHGHAVGDQVLREVAHRLKQCLRLSDHLARIGGDEFLVLLPETRLEEGLAIAARLRASVGDEPLRVGESAIPLTVSIGVGHVPPESSTVQDVTLATESALHDSKQHGKNRVTSAALASEGREGATRAAAAILDLFQEGQLRAVFHPIVRLADERLEGFEVLSRGPEGPLAMPDSFFRACADPKRLAALDLQCLRTCLRSIDLADPAGPSRFHLNLFPSTILDTPVEDLLVPFRAVRREARFCIELNEQQSVGGAGVLRDRIRSLRAAGISIAIDDVGFGNSSLETLVLLEPEIVKLDRSCVQGSGGDPEKLASLGRLVDVAHALGSEPVAEGLESRDDLAAMQGLGVRYGQGFLWGEPRPLARTSRSGA